MTAERVPQPHPSLTHSPAVTAPEENEHEPQ